jgi:CRP-like cAMP-binding protein
MIKSEVVPLSAAIRNVFANLTKTQESESFDQYGEVRKCSFFDSLADKQLSMLVEQSTIRKLVSGTSLTTEGTAGTSFFVILSGTATVLVNEMHMGIVQCGDCIGEGLFFSDKYSTSETVIANGDVVVLELTKRIVDSMSGEVKIRMEKALLQALYRKLQRSNVLNELLHKQWIASLCRQD